MAVSQRLVLAVLALATFLEFMAIQLILNPTVFCSMDTHAGYAEPWVALETADRMVSVSYDDDLLPLASALAQAVTNYDTLLEEERETDSEATMVKVKVPPLRGSPVFAVRIRPHDGRRFKRSWSDAYPECNRTSYDGAYTSCTPSGLWVIDFETCGNRTWDDFDSIAGQVGLLLIPLAVGLISYACYRGVRMTSFKTVSSADSMLFWLLVGETFILLAILIREFSFISDPFQNEGVDSAFVFGVFFTASIVTGLEFCCFVVQSSKLGVDKSKVGDLALKSSI